jgi:NAD+-dependent protein deacetylase sirtuin 4
LIKIIGQKELAFIQELIISNNKSFLENIFLILFYLIRPMQHNDFCTSANKRKIYWARNYVSWPIFSSFKPNINHKILTDWEKKGKVHHHVTQNVDALLVKSGCLKLTELHGSSYKVKCLDCDFKLSRDSMQKLIQSINPVWSIETEDEININPDNDVRLSPEQIENFQVPKCPKCKSDRLKPDIGKKNL